MKVTAYRGFSEHDREIFSMSAALAIADGIDPSNLDNPWNRPWSISVILAACYASPNSRSINHFETPLSRASNIRP